MCSSHSVQFSALTSAITTPSSLLSLCRHFPTLFSQAWVVVDTIKSPIFRSIFPFPSSSNHARAFRALMKTIQCWMNYSSWSAQGQFERPHKNPTSFRRLGFPRRLGRSSWFWTSESLTLVSSINRFYLPIESFL